MCGLYIKYNFQNLLKYFSDSQNKIFHLKRWEQSHMKSNKNIFCCIIVTNFVDRKSGMKSEKNDFFN
jgi:hypothetical protein